MCGIVAYTHLGEYSIVQRVLETHIKGTKTSRFIIMLKVNNNPMNKLVIYLTELSIYNKSNINFTWIYHEIIFIIHQ